MAITQSYQWAPGALKSSGDYTGGPAKGLLHATIAPSMALPGYASQSMAPHATYLWNPTIQRIVPYQHYYWNQFSKALANKPGGVETNRDSVRQVELAGYLGANGATVPKGEFDILEAPDIYWEQVADLFGPVLVDAGVKNNIYPTSSGRMSLSSWDNFSGLCTHGDAPENDHWDLPIPEPALKILGNKIWGNSNLIVTPSPVDVNKYSSAPTFPYSPLHYFGTLERTNNYCHSGVYSAKDRGYIRQFQYKLRQRGWNIDVDGLFGKETNDVVAAFQREKRLTDRVGKVGPTTWRTIWTAPVT